MFAEKSFLTYFVRTELKNIFFLFSEGQEYYCEKHDSYYQSNSVSFSSLNHVHLNVPEPVEARDISSAFLDSDEDYPTQNNLNQTDFSHTRPIVIESEHTKYDSFHEPDSANHSFDDGVDEVDGLMKPVNGCDYDKNDQIQKKLHGNSVDSGISNNINGNTINGTQNHLNGHTEKCTEGNEIKNLPSRLSDLSLKDSDNVILPDTSSDEDRFESDTDVSPRIKNGCGSIHFKEKKNGISLNLKLQNEIR